MSEIKQRLPSTKKTSPSSDFDSDSDDDRKNPQVPQAGPSMAQRALASTAHLANLLPTGTLLAFQLLTPVFTNNGQCDVATRAMTGLLLAVLALSGFLACFTDSFRAPDGQVYYGFATPKGMYLFDNRVSGSGQDGSGPDLSKYRLGLIDWVHAVLSVLVFGVVAFRDRNVVSCFYPKPSHEAQEVLDILPVGVGLICSLLFVAFPTRRHGIGYPVTSGR